MAPTTLVPVAILAGLLGLAAGLGNWREPLLAASLLPLLALLFGRRRDAPLPPGPDALFWRGCLLYALTALVLAGLDLLAQVRLAELLSPLATNPIEGREALKGWLLSQGQTIYPGPTPAYPRLVTLYPPLYFAVTAAFAALTGPGLLAGKLAALAGGLLLLAALFGLGRRCGGGLTGLLAALAFFAAPEAGNAFACKPDTLAVGCLLAGCLALAVGLTRGSWPWLVVSGALVAVACLGKQQIWPLAAVFGAWLFVSPLTWGQRRAALAGLVGTGLALAGLSVFWFGPGLVGQTVFFPAAMSGLAADNSQASAAARFAAYLSGHGPLLAAYAGWLLLCLQRRRLPLPDLLLAAFLPFLWRTLMWGGSDTNHFLFVSAVACLGAASLAATLAAGSVWGRAVAVLILAALTPAGITLHRPSALALTPPPAAVAEAGAVRAALAAIPGDLLIDAEGAYLFAGTADFPRLRLYDAFETDMLDRLGLAPMLASPMAADITGRRAARFVDSQVFVSQKLLSLVQLYYEPAGRVGRYAFYRPRPETALIALPVADRAARSDGGFTAAAVEAANLRQWGDYIQAEDPGRPLVLAYRVSGPAAVRAFVSYCPRLTGPGQTVAVSAIAADGRELARAVHTFGDFPERGEGFDNRTRLDFPVQGEGVVVRFELGGAAQLWLRAGQPLLIGVTAAP
jgi:hypothetical protein